LNKDEVNSGDVFYAFNKDMFTPKVKYHLCLSENSYFIINTKSHSYDLQISPADCSILKYECYINCNQLFTEPISNFNIIKIEELSYSAIERLINKVKYSPALTGIQIKKIISELELCLQKRNLQSNI